MSVSRASYQLVMRIAEGKRTVTYRPTQERTADGLEIWEADQQLVALTRDQRRSDHRVWSALSAEACSAEGCAVLRWTR
jgi:hypothetical protein